MTMEHFEENTLDKTGEMIYLLQSIKQTNEQSLFWVRLIGVLVILTFILMVLGPIFGPFILALIV